MAMPDDPRSLSAAGSLLKSAAEEPASTGRGGLVLQTVVRFSFVCLAALALACGAGGGGDVADNGGMSGTGLSQGRIDAFGSIFVNGIQWNIASAAIEVDGGPASSSDLRVGMVVRVQGDFTVAGTTGTATSVEFDDAIEGPITATPVDVMPGGPERAFSVLGINIIMHDVDTVYAGGAGFLTLAANDVVEISGFVDENGAIRATRIELEGAFPADSGVEIRDRVSGLISNGNGTGSFMLGVNLVRYTASTTFEDLTEQALSDGDLVEVEGDLRLSGNEIDATKIELETEGLGAGNADEAELEGIVSNFVSNSSFRVAGTQVDASSATFDPPGFVVMDGAEVEVEGSLQSGTLVATRVESESDQEDVRIEAQVSAVNSLAMELTILGVTISADAQTRIEDERDGDPDFMFSEIQPGDWLDIEAIQTGPSTALALQIERDANDTDVLLEAPVTALDVNAPSLSLLGQPIPLFAGTLYFDSNEMSRTETEFFRIPGDVSLGDIVRATDLSGSDLQVLGEADEVELD